MRVLIVDDHPMVQEMMGTIVAAAFPDAEVLIEKDLAVAIERASALRRLDLVLLDLGLPGCRGIEALVRFKSAFSVVPIAIVSATEDSGTIRSALRAGAAGYIPKITAPKVVVAALRLIVAGGTYLPMEAVSDVLEGEMSERSGGVSVSGESVLSARQIDVLRMLVRGIGNREIAQSLGIAENTVKQHAHTLYRALGVSNRTQAAGAAVRKGIQLD